MKLENRTANSGLPRSPKSSLVTLRSARSPDLVATNTNTLCSCLKSKLNTPDCWICPTTDSSELHFVPTMWVKETQTITVKMLKFFILFVLKLILGTDCKSAASVVLHIISLHNYYSLASHRPLNHLGQ